MTIRYGGKNTIDEFDNESGSITERQEQKKKKKNIDTPDNFKFGDMPAGFRKRYLQMLREQAK